MAERIFGEIPGITQGTIFKDRKELAAALVHRPVQAGISGSEKEGADSIVMSGGYDDRDFGDVIIYTGHGGRDEKSGKLVSSQEMRLQNLALVKSMELGLPVRVVRGSRLKSSYSPSNGYRYDGLYRVEDYWHEVTNEIVVWKYKLTKIEGTVIPHNPSEVPYNSAERKETVSMRLLRDTKKSLEVKQLYDYHCQVCGVRLEGPNGPYAEAAHIKPLGEPHNGPDISGNIICLCPNHHKLFDLRAFGIDTNMDLIGITGKLFVNKKHQLDIACLEYRKSRY